MFGLAVRYLMGWAMAAADGARKERPEWPPHPDRLFMALAAACFETGADPAERAALEWLETLPPPGIEASEASSRLAVTSYVPVNDAQLGKKLPAESKRNLDALKEAGLDVVPEYRARQARSFPVAVPRDPTVFFVWPDAELPAAHRSAFEGLCAKVTHLGHSASLVQAWVEESPPQPRLVPKPGSAPHRLRVFGKGRLAELERTVNLQALWRYAELEEAVRAATAKTKKQAKAALDAEFPDGLPVSRHPAPGLWMGYGERAAVVPEIAASVFDPAFTVLSLQAKRPGLRATLRLVEALRALVLDSCPKPVPEWISGHAADGSPTKAPHLALLPLPFVGREHADGRILGIALAAPRSVAPEEVARCLGPLLTDDEGLPRELRLFDGAAFECVATAEAKQEPPYNLRPETWTSPSRRWASVTPVALDRHFDGPDKWERAAETIKDACAYVGLPRPIEVLLHPVSMIEGAPRSSDYPPVVRKSGGRMHHSHAVLLFDREVRGPVVLGAGRYRGYGLFRPLYQGVEADA